MSTRFHRDFTRGFYLFVFLKWCYHHNSGNFQFPNHTQEVYDHVLGWTWSENGRDVIQAEFNLAEYINYIWIQLIDHKIEKCLFKQLFMYDLYSLNNILYLSSTYQNTLSWSFTVVILIKQKLKSVESILKPSNEMRMTLTLWCDEYHIILIPLKIIEKYM